MASAHIYPIKSVRAIDLKTAIIRPRGLKGDRRYLLVDDDGKFITQRTVPQMAQLAAVLNVDGLTLHWNGQSLSCPLAAFKTRLDVTVWRNTVNALRAPELVNHTISEWLNTPARLVFMDNGAKRMANPEWTAHLDRPAPVSFADGYPILIANTASLAALNADIKNGPNANQAPIAMSRFRPNLVIQTDQAWAEDEWKQIKIGGVILDLIKPCTRCIIPNLDPQTGENLGAEPLQTLTKTRKSPDPRNKGVLFGVNAVPRTLGTVEMGQMVEVLR